jgi:hypothetical protein
MPVPIYIEEDLCHGSVHDYPGRMVSCWWECI